MFWYRLFSKIDWVVVTVTTWLFLSRRVDCICPSRDSVVKTHLNLSHKFCHPSKKDLFFYYACSAQMEGIVRKRNSYGVEDVHFTLEKSLL